MEKIKSFAEALATAQFNMNKTISKDSKNTAGKGYRYISGTATLLAVKECLKELGLSYSIGIDPNYPVSWDEKPTKFGGNMYCLNAIGIFKWYFRSQFENEVIEVPFVLVGENTDKAKAFGTAMTYSERYMLSKQLGIPSDELDPDDTNHPSNKKIKKETIDNQPEPQEFEVGRKIYDEIKSLVKNEAEKWSKPIQKIMKNNGIKKLSDLLYSQEKASQMVIELETLKSIFENEVIENG